MSCGPCAGHVQPRLVVVLYIHGRRDPIHRERISHPAMLPGPRPRLVRQTRRLRRLSLARADRKATVSQKKRARRTDQEIAGQTATPGGADLRALTGPQRFLAALPTLPGGLADAPPGLRSEPPYR